MSGKHCSQQVLVALTNNRSLQLLCNNQPRRPWWHWTGNQMPLHDDKCSACPTLGKGSKGVDDFIWF